MLSKTDLRGVENSSLWDDPDSVVGEFNPKVASGMTLQKTKRLTVPLDSWKNSGVHHLPNKYIKNEREGGDIQFASMTTWNTFFQAARTIT